MTPSLPGWRYIQIDYAVALESAVNLADRLLFHIQPVGVTLPPNDGAGDTWKIQTGNFSMTQKKRLVFRTV